MELEGGVRVTVGEQHRRDQPFRVCVHDVGDQHSEVWTSVREEAVDACTMVIKRVLREGMRVKR